jgi:hypothetical protein
MERKNLFKKDGQNIFRVNRIFNTKITTFHLHPDYGLDISGINEMTKTGLIIIFALKPKIAELPSFVGRWDQVKSVVDIDIREVECGVQNLFKSEKNGYSGHHPQVISESPRLFAINIKTPGQNIFQGNLTFNINHGHDPNLFK